MCVRGKEQSKTYSIVVLLFDNNLLDNWCNLKLLLGNISLECNQYNLTKAVLMSVLRIVQSNVQSEDQEKNGIV